MRRIKILCAALGAPLSVSAILSSAAARLKITILALAVVGPLSALLAPGALAIKKPIPPLAIEPTRPVILNPGDPLKWLTSDAMLSTPAGSISCSSGELDGTLTSNGMKMDGFTINAASFNNGPGPAGPTPCTSPLGPATISFPPGFMSTGSFKPQNGKMDSIGPMSFSADFTPTGLMCTWSASKVKGMFNHDGSAVMVTVMNQKFKLSAGSDSCPGKGAFTGSFSLLGEKAGATSFFDVFVDI
jgi:hypothetical protein